MLTQQQFLAILQLATDTSQSTALVRDRCYAELLSQNHKVLLDSLLEAIKRLKLLGEEEVSRKDMIVAQLNNELHVKHQAVVELTNFRNLVLQQTTPGFTIPSVYPGSPMTYPQSPNYADIGRQVLVHSYSMNLN
jgi:hypothetical protein